MSRRARSRLAPTLLLAAVLGVAVAACSSDDTGSPPPSAGSVAPGSTPGSTSAVTDEQRLAAAKTVAVGFFEAQAVNAYDQALELSTDAAARTIEWARGVNGIAAADGTPYQVPSVEAPNVRVQIDGLDPDGADRWTAVGFVELSFRPGPVVSTTSTTAPTGAPTTEVAAPGTPATYAVDLTFTGDGERVRLADYRLDDVPYPVSQLFTSFTVPSDTASGVEGQVVLGHRDLDGSVQYLVELDQTGEGEAQVESATFTPLPQGATPGTATIPPDTSTVEGTTFADPLAAGATGDALIVFPGAFPGSAGTLAVEVTGGATASGVTTTVTTDVEAGPLAWALPAFPDLTPRPVGTVTTSTTTSSTTTSSTSTTSTTQPSSSTTAATTTPTTSTGPTSSASTSSTTTTTASTSTTTTTSDG